MKTPHLHGIDALIDRALEAARARKIVVPGEAPTADLIRDMAAEALESRAKIVRIDRDLEGLLADHPDGALIRSLPGMGAVLAAEFVACVGDIRRFASADALASAAGLAPVQRQSGKRAGWRRAYGGDKALKRVFYQSAFCAVTTRDPLSKAFYDRKRRLPERNEALDCRVYARAAAWIVGADRWGEARWQDLEGQTEPPSRRRRSVRSPQRAPRLGGRTRCGTTAERQISFARSFLYSSSEIEPDDLSLSSFSLSSATLKPTMPRSCSFAASACTESRSDMPPPWVNR